ncbi:MAG: hypothetical protein K8I03_04340 [Ignavibacteria bacterium]|nr:hypothetical protein [Ignavibacteria bacterium]
METYQKHLLNNLHLFLASFLLIISGFTIQIQSQDETIIDSLTTGQKYRITLYNEKEIIGKVVKQDSVYAYVVSESGTSRVKKEDIFDISVNTNPKILKAMISLGGGIVFPSSFEDGYNSRDKAGFSLQLSALKPLDENKAIRIDLSYGRIKRNDYYSYYGYGSSYQYPEERFRDLYYINGNFMFGNFNTDSKFSIYGLFGMGIFILKEKDFTYTYYNNYDSTYYTDVIRGIDDAYMNITFGGGLRFNIKNRIGAYAEVQYNMFTHGGYLFFFGSGYFPIRAGLTYTFY